MPILPDDDIQYFVVGGPQIDPSIYRTKIGTGGKSEDEPEGAKNTEQQVQPDNSPKMCEECGKYPADLPSNLCCGCDTYKDGENVFCEVRHGCYRSWAEPSKHQSWGDPGPDFTPERGCENYWPRENHNNVKSGNP